MVKQTVSSSRNYIMVERIYVTTDTKVWAYLVQSSFSYMIQFYSHTHFSICGFVVFFSALAGFFTLSLSVATVLVYFLIPMPYFIKELFLAIHSKVYKHCSEIWKFQGIGKCGNYFQFCSASPMVLFSVHFFYSLWLTEVTMFTDNRCRQSFAL